MREMPRKLVSIEDAAVALLKLPTRIRLLPLETLSNVTGFDRDILLSALFFEFTIKRGVPLPLVGRAYPCISLTILRSLVGLGT